MGQEERPKLSLEEILALVEAYPKHHKSSIKWWIEQSYQAGREDALKEAYQWLWYGGASLNMKQWQALQSGNLPKQKEE